MWEYNNSVYPDELYHWKYIKRYKGSNGKWRYVYADKNTHESIDRYKNAAHESAKLAAVDKGIANNASKKARPLSINEFNTNMDIYWKYKNDKFTINDDFKSRKFDTNEYIKRIQENEDKHQPIYLTQYTKQRYDEFMDRAAANSFNSKMYTSKADSLINRNAVGDDAVDLVSKGKEYLSKLFKRK